MARQHTIEAAVIDVAGEVIEDLELTATERGLDGNITRYLAHALAGYLRLHRMAPSPDAEVVARTTYLDESFALRHEVVGRMALTPEPEDASSPLPRLYVKE
jgi:hypothetical protein